MGLTAEAIRSVVERALAEDAPWGDITSEALVPEKARAQASLVAREPGVMSGGAVFEAAFRLIEQWTPVELLVADGERFDAAETLAAVDGNARTVLRGERVALNFVQRMCGIATLTAAYVDAVSGTKACIADTRKTTPGLRALERHAVHCGGGHNHRYSLSDAVLVKDNHLATLAGEGIDITVALRQVRERIPHSTTIEVEVDRLDQIEAVLAAGVDTIMLDNFSLADLGEGVRLVDGRATVEASGGVTLETVRAIAETGVDVISVGALTHAARALDLGLDIETSP